MARQRRSPVTAYLVVVVALVLFAGVAITLYRNYGGTEFSNVTAETLRDEAIADQGTPVQVPQRLPDAASEAGSGFLFARVVRPGLAGPSPLRYVSTYQVDATAMDPDGEPGLVYQVELRQFSADTSEAALLCRSGSSQEPVVRTDEAYVLLVCTEQLADPAAREYWESVALTSDYASVVWID